MAIQIRYSVAALVVAAAAFTASASAAQGGRVSGSLGHRTPVNSTPAAAKMTPQQRGQSAKAFVNRWGGYVQRVYGVNVGVWSKRMVPTFASVDSDNFRNALKRDTFEGAMAELSGTGQRLTDDQMITKFARMQKASNDLPALGSSSNDLVYTPIQPCRIFDTRQAGGGGKITGGATRDFVTTNQANYTAQGGSTTDCGTLGVSAAAVAINLTAVNYTGTGHAVAYPFGTSTPNAASVNFNAGNYATNNGVIVKIPSPLTTSDLTLFTTTTADFVGDIVGYFAAPQATALQCTETFASANAPAGLPFDLYMPNCPTGYALTGAACRTQNFGDVEWAVTGLIRQGAGNVRSLCSGLNKTAGVVPVEGTAQCCRVPGR